MLRNLIFQFILVALSFYTFGQKPKTPPATPPPPEWTVISDTALTLAGATDDLEVAVFGPKGAILAAAGMDNFIRIYRSDTVQMIREIKAHSAGIVALAFSRDAEYIMSGSKDFTAKIFEVKTGKQLFAFIGHRNVVTSVFIDPTFKFAYTASSDGTIKAWNLARFGELERTYTLPTGVNSITLSMSGAELYAALEDGTIRLLDFKGEIKQTFDGHAGHVNSISYAMNNKYLLSGGNDGRAILWHPKSGEKIRELTGHTWKVMSVAISSDSKYALTGSNDGTTKLWDIETGKCLYSFEGHGNFIRSVSWQPDMVNIATTALVRGAKKEYLVYLWNSRVGKMNELIEKRKELSAQKEAQDSVRAAEMEKRREELEKKKEEEQRKREEDLKKRQEQQKGQKP